MKSIELKDGDINVVNGKISTISGNNKLKQQLGKIVLTRIGNYLHPKYGTEIMNILGSPYTDLQESVKATIRNALDYFISLQARGILFNIYDLEEILYKVSYLHVQQGVGEKRASFVKIGVLDGTRQNVDIEQTVSV
jgi:hypothetical protein